VANPVSLQFREVSTGRFRDVGTGRFIPNPIGIQQLKVGAQMKYMLHEVAETITEAAKELARSEAYLSGDYYRSIRPASGIEKTESGPAAIARVNAWDWKAGWIEFGSIHNNPPRRILQRAAEASGYQVSVGRNVRRVTGTGFERVIKLAAS
jgi:hypothetical protein